MVFNAQGTNPGAKNRAQDLLRMCETLGGVFPCLTHVRDGVGHVGGGADVRRSSGIFGTGAGDLVGRCRVCRMLRPFCFSLAAM